jgi:hypothetical protein
MASFSSLLPAGLSDFPVNPMIPVDSSAIIFYHILRLPRVAKATFKNLRLGYTENADCANY